jgi:hypothetical protein
MIFRLSLIAAGVEGLARCCGGKSAQIKNEKRRQKAFQFYRFRYGYGATGL